MTKLPPKSSKPLFFKRLPANTNLSLVNGHEFRELPVITTSGLLVSDYLERLYTTIHLALQDSHRVWAVRFDLRFPASWTPEQVASVEPVIGRFWESLKAQIKNDRNQAAKYLERSHDTVVRYVWAREMGGDGKPHYHCLLLLNGDAYSRLGRDGSQNMTMLARIQEAWCRTLRLPWREFRSLVHIPANPEYRIMKTGTPSAELKKLFFRCSYLCKANTKCYGDHRQSFGYSRR